MTPTSAGSLSTPLTRAARLREPLTRATRLREPRRDMRISPIQLRGNREGIRRKTKQHKGQDVSHKGIWDVKVTRDQRGSMGRREWGAGYMGADGEAGHRRGKSPRMRAAEQCSQSAHAHRGHALQAALDVRARGQRQRARHPSLRPHRTPPHRTTAPPHHTAPPRTTPHHTRERATQQRGGTGTAVRGDVYRVKN